MKKKIKRFAVGQKVVYPSHGVGEVVDIYEKELLGKIIRLYVINFVHDKIKIKVPITRAISDGLRPLIEKSNLRQIYSILQETPEASIYKMWSKRVQGYKKKINSGSPQLLATVIRDLYEGAEINRSYSERKIYIAAMERLAAEISTLTNTNKEKVINHIVMLLQLKLA